MSNIIKKILYIIMLSKQLIVNKMFVLEIILIHKYYQFRMINLLKIVEIK